MLVTHDPDGVGQELEINFLFLGVMGLFRPRRHFRPGAPVNQIDLIRAQSLRHPCGVHRHIAAADDGNLFPHPHRGVVIRKEISLHQV